jgi:hypothetical protein
VYSEQEHDSFDIDPFNVEEPDEDLEPDEYDNEDGGVVKPDEPLELRPYISAAIVALWLAGMAWGVETFITTGNPMIIILTHSVLHGPLAEMLKYYYKH